MSAPRSTSFAIVLGAALTVGSASPGVAAGGFFESIGALFNRPAARVEPFYGPSEPLSVTVRPRRQSGHARTGRTFTNRRTAGPKLKQAARQPAKRLAVPMDSVNDPTWYLRDPTLRRGDIVVLKSGVVVFDGVSAAEHGAGDFTPIGQARLLSPNRRQEIAEMAAGFKAPAGAERRPFPAAKTSRTEISAAR